MEYYTYKEKSKFYVLPMLAVHNDSSQIDLELAWFKWGVFIHIYTK